ncbi:signal recognition particle receptor subunit beta isoform X1 [Amblyraja radiata]|uniref:signal recognition particle receptor subunit beta isoform X1 n=1 Tax=Amblyraja radiata TaxID=386614 RepID=UPI001401FE28|nr:signal recognition particle receptor subunit beta isoform X1 [Amblyraja radiata]
MAGASVQLYMESLWEELKEYQEPSALGIGVAVVAVLLTIVIFILLRSRKSSRRAVLLTGLCDSGKTLLCCRLLSGKFKMTHTSITSNSALYKVKGDKAPAVTLHDLPGHESLRHQYLEKHKNDARAIVFVVDSVSFQKEVKDVAEFLYMLLTDAVLVKNAPPFLIACNKQDVTMAKSAKLIQHQLEKELNTLRTIRSGAPKALDGSGIAGSVPLGRKGKEYDFSQGPMKIEFAECSVRGNKGDEGEADISVLETWLVKVA